MTAVPISLPLLDRLGDRLAVDVEASRIAGVDLLVGDRQDDRWRCSIGYRDVVTNDLLHADAVWRIYSMTKINAIARMIDECNSVLGVRSVMMVTSAAGFARHGVLTRGGQLHDRLRNDLQCLPTKITP